eukprot:5766036-Prymnesium_polylepis.1
MVSLLTEVETVLSKLINYDKTSSSKQKAQGERQGRAQEAASRSTNVRREVCVQHERQEVCAQVPCQRNRAQHGRDTQHIFDGADDEREGQGRGCRERQRSCADPQYTQWEWPLARQCS